MSPNTKERLILSVAGGAAIPASYFIGVVALAYVGADVGSGLLLLLPLVWPAYLYSFLLPAFADDFWLFNREAVLLVAAANFVLYFLLTYAVIRWRQRMPRLR